MLNYAFLGSYVYTLFGLYHILTYIFNLLGDVLLSNLQSQSRKDSEAVSSEFLIAIDGLYSHELTDTPLNKSITGTNGNNQVV